MAHGRSIVHLGRSHEFLKFRRTYDEHCGKLYHAVLVFFVAANRSDPFELGRWRPAGLAGGPSRARLRDNGHGPLRVSVSLVAEDRGFVVARKRFQSHRRSQFYPEWRAISGITQDRTANIGLEWRRCVFAVLGERSGRALGFVAFGHSLHRSGRLVISTGGLDPPIPRRKPCSEEAEFDWLC